MDRSISTFGRTEMTSFYRDSPTALLTGNTLCLQDKQVDFSDSRYRVKLAETRQEIESALRLRFNVFNVEIANRDIDAGSSRLEFDDYDFKCKHLIVIDESSGATVGTYRLNSIESAKSAKGFYSYGEFSIEDLPLDVLQQGIEIGRASIAKEHRNTKVLFLLWKGLANYLKYSEKRFFFGCCSIFSRDVFVGENAFRHLTQTGRMHKTLCVEPRRNGIYYTHDNSEKIEVELPGLFNMYLRIGAKVCGPPMIDHDFGTIDFFVVFDIQELNEKYRRMFFA